MNDNQTIFDKSCKGRNHFKVEADGVDSKKPECYLPGDLIRKGDIGLPELSENEVIRHYTNLAAKNYGVDNGIYPLGSCTMKYSPKINEEIASWPEFKNIHPYQDSADTQGTLEVYYRLGQLLKEIVGLDAVTFQPSAGAHGEFCSLLIIKKYFDAAGEKRNLIIIPDSAHGTNFASAAMAGFEVMEIRSGRDGTIDVTALKNAVNDLKSSIAAIMITNPNTLGIFEKDIMKISKLMHDNGSLLYYDGANLNAIAGQARPGDMGFDLVHLNLHKTFSTPHGGGGPGAGPVLVTGELSGFLPVPVVGEKDGKYYLDYEAANSIGRVKSFSGNFSVCLKAYCYLLAVGSSIKDISEDAVLNANYLKKKLSDIFEIPYGKNCMHEFVASSKKYKDRGGTALNIAKRLIDYGIHPPTVYFPHIVEEAIMIEPTETENLDNLDNFVSVLKSIIKEVESGSSDVANAPVKTKICRINELKALKEPVLKQ